VIPAAIGYQARLLSVVKKLHEIRELVPDLSPKTQTEILRNVTTAIERVNQKRNELEAALHKAESIGDESQKAKFIADHVVELMSEVRKPCDELEVSIADDLWPLPRYSEMLFIL
jgi:glutamine synthetase